MSSSIDRGTVRLVGAKGEPILVDSPRAGANSVNRIGGYLREAMDADDSVGFMRIPSYQHADEWMNDLVRGTTADQGFTPIKDSDLSSVVSRRQTMASTWEVLASGRQSPLTRFKDIFNMANDGQGGDAFASDIVGSLDTTNRGAFIALIPIDSLEIESWSDFGIEATPMDGDEDSGYYELSVDPTKIRSNYGLWAIDPLDCWPTGDARAPFWFSKDNKWYAVPSGLGFHISQPVGAPSKKYAGWGQCGTWRYIGNVVTDQLIRAMEFEALLNEPPRAIIGVSGVDYVGQFEEAMEANSNAIRDGDALFFPGRVFFETTSPSMDIMVRSWVEAPKGYDPQQWRVFREDALTSAFHMSVAFLRTRIGTGAFSQSDVTAEIQSETGIAWARGVLESIYNRIVRRVTVSVIVPSDKATSRKYERLLKLSESLAKIESSKDEEVFTIDETRQLVRDTGIEIKDADDSIKAIKVDGRDNTDV